MDHADRLADPEDARGSRSKGAVEPSRTLKAKRRNRAEQTEETFRQLVAAAVDVIGEAGYEGVTIARLTVKANVSVGTFYTYFESRQDLFDRLLPLVGEELLGFVAARVKDGKTTFEREELGFRALFEFYLRNPGLYRLVNEAETMAPLAHEAHFKKLVDSYVRSLEIGVQRGEISGYVGQELEALAYMLLSMRSYLMMRYAKSGKSVTRIPEWLVLTYMKFVRGALHAN